MEVLNQIFSLDWVAFNVLDYPLSYIELIGTITGLISVLLAAKPHVLTWPIGLVNVIAFFAIFYQIALYSDMLLQVYFFIVCIYGWLNWKNRNEEESFSDTLNNKQRAIYTGINIAGIIALGILMTKIHILLPNLFSQEASYPFMDAFTTVLSITATILLAKRKLESWVLWIFVDGVCIGMYFKKGIPFIALEYLIFLLIATFGFFKWKKLLNNG